MSTSSTTDNSDTNGNGIAIDSAHNLQPSVALNNNTSSAPIVSNKAARPTGAIHPNSSKVASIAELSRSNGSVSSNASGSFSYGGSKESVCVSVSVSGVEASAEAQAEDVDVRRDVLAAFRISADYNFWKPDAYLQTFVKRLAEGKSACEKLATLLAGRATLEKQVAKLYKQWASKAHSFVSNSETRAHF